MEFQGAVAATAKSANRAEQHWLRPQQTEKGNRDDDEHADNVSEDQPLLQDVGIFGSDAAGKGILSNSSFANGGLGIDLIGGVEDSSGNTANDPGDNDTGSNGPQNKPVLSSAKTVSGTTTIKGSLSSTPNGTYKLQFFSNPSGNEGKRLIGQKTITIDDPSYRSFTFQPASKVATGRTVTATATNGSTLDTSEFSGPRTVVSS